MPRHIRKGDVVVVTAGNDRGVTGQILRVLTSSDRVVVQGVNVRSKHLKPSQRSPQGGIVRREMPIHMSNVSPVVDGKPTRVRFEIRPDGSKARVAVVSGKELHILHGPRGAAPAGRAGEARPSRGRKTKKQEPKASPAGRGRKD